ncbi:hypothetical protein CXU10_01995 [Akkermansia muciniphila]|nr:hypothetical protein CXU10_01995 [Akkermansia muciniphila]
MGRACVEPYGRIIAGKKFSLEPYGASKNAGGRGFFPCAREPLYSPERKACGAERVEEHAVSAGGVGPFPVIG